MSKLVPVFYSMMVGWGVLTLDFHNFSVRNPTAPTVDYLVGLSNRIGGPLGMAGGRVDLAELLPPAPQGWTRRPYTPADGALIARVAFDPAAPIHDQTAAVLRDYAASTTPDMNFAMTYEKAMTDDEDRRLVVLRLAYNPDLDVSRIEHTASTGRDTPDLPPGARAYGVIKGLAFAQAAVTRTDPETGQATAADHRLLMAVGAGQASLTVLTNAGDKSLRRVLKAADMQALRGFLQDPKPAVAALAEANRLQAMGTAAVH